MSGGLHASSLLEHECSNECEGEECDPGGTERAGRWFNLF